MSNNHYTSIIATHQARIRCLLSKLFNKKFQRFKNGAVISLEIKPNGDQKPSVECNLLYEGELASNENKQDVIYYVNGDSGQQENYTGEKFETITSNTYNLQFENTNNDTYTFFLIRHGQGEHNILKGNQKKYQQVFGKKDSELTGEGREQAERAGRSIGNSSPFMLLSANYFFCSDLSRTIQTMAYFLLSLCKTVNNNGNRQMDSLLPPNLVEDSLDNGILKSKNIIVLPCSHELTYKKDGNCDGNQYMNPNENLPSSSTLSNLIQDYEGFDIIWETYAKFYNNSSRSASLNLNKSKCRNTNFIQEAIDYINLNKTPPGVMISKSVSNLTPVGGKKSKKKKTYKKKTYKKKTYKKKNKKKNLKQKKKTFKRRKRKTRKNNHKRGGEKIGNEGQGALISIGRRQKNKITKREAAQQQAIDYERNNQNALNERNKENQLREQKKNSLEQKYRDEVESANRGYLTNLAIKSIQGKREWSDWNPIRMAPNPPPELYK